MSRLIFRRAVHFLKALEASRCGKFKEYCWGYPFDWVTRNGVIPRQTPLITTTPYGYEAFLHVHRLDPRAEWFERAGIDRPARCHGHQGFPHIRNSQQLLIHPVRSRRGHQCRCVTARFC